MNASLHVIEGPDRGRLFTLASTTVTLGRSADNTIVLNDVAVSGTHSRIVRSEAGQFTIHDNTSTNGTFVNGREARVVDLKHGDTIRVGGTVLAFELRKQGGGILPARQGDLDHGAVAAVGGLDEYEAPALLDAAKVGRDELERLVRRAAIMDHLDRRLAELETPSEVLTATVDAALTATAARRGFVLLVDDRSGEIVPSVVRDLTATGTEIAFSKSLAFDVVTAGRGVATEDGEGAQRRPVLVAPIVVAGRVIGVLHVDSPLGTFGPTDLEALEAIGRRAGAAVSAARSRVDFEVLFSSMIDAMMKSIQAKDVYTRGHSERVRHYSRLIGKELGLSHQELYRLTLGAAVHDIGKIGMPDSVLKFNTNPKLSEEQMDEVKKHPVRGAQILGEIPFLRDVVAAAELHHEDWNGGGYPHGLKGEEIPLMARIVAVADTYDAITTDRPYQKGASYEAGLGILRKIGGKRLDVDLVEAFARAWQKYRKGPAAGPAPSEPEETFKIEGAEARKIAEAVNQTVHTARPAIAAAAAPAASAPVPKPAPAAPGPSAPGPNAPGPNTPAPNGPGNGDDGDLGEALRQIILIG